MRLTSFLAALFFVVTSDICTAQTAASISGTFAHDIKSSKTGDVYRVFVAVPESYAEANDKRFPVLLVLDANALFPIAVGIQRLLRITSEAPDLIVVGLGYPVDYYSETLTLRWHDLTPSRDPPTDSMYVSRIASFARNRKPVPLQSGGAPTLLEVLNSEIIPLIDRAYRTTPDRALMGHSFGGLFAAYAMFTKPELFNRYALLSPSVWWNAGDIYTFESSYAVSQKRLGARVFMSVGEREGNPMVTGTDSLAKRLKSRGYPNMVIIHEVLGGETHVSTVPAAITRAIRWLYVDTTSRPL